MIAGVSSLFDERMQGRRQPLDRGDDRYLYEDRWPKAQGDVVGRETRPVYEPPSQYDSWDESRDMDSPSYGVETTLPESAVPTELWRERNP
jgi:hypothetical protein